METIVLLLSCIGVLVVLWFFIWMMPRTLHIETTDSASLRLFRQASSAPAKRSQRSQIPRRLLVTSGPLADSCTNLDNQRNITISHSESNAFVLNDDFVSGQHAHVINHDDIWYLEDLNPRSGAFLNGQCVEQPE